MFLRFSLVVLCLAIPCSVFAQGPIYRGPNGQVLLPSNQPPQQGIPSGLSVVPSYPQVVPSYPQVVPSYPQVVPSYPQGTFHNRIPGGWASPNVVTGINSQTGGLNTSSSQVDDSTFAFGREQGKVNQQWVRRPVYGANGQVTGYQEGHVWRNPYTGQEHGNLKNYTPNNQGGVNTQVQTRSRRQ